MSGELRYIAAEALNFATSLKYLGQSKRKTTFSKGRFIRPPRGSKFANKPTPRSGAPSRTFIHHRDRIKQFNIHPGDRVRLLTGKAMHKYNDESQGEAGGWKLYTVKTVDMKLNRVFLEGLTQKKSSQPKPKPVNFDSMTEEAKTKWQEGSQIVSPMKPIHYSNLGLLVEEDVEDPANHVFAKTLTRGPGFSAEGQWRWERYAARLTGPTNHVPDPDKGKVKIAWPTKPIPEKPLACEQDTQGALVSGDTLALPDEVTMAQEAERAIVNSLLPLTLRSPPPTDQSISDDYINTPDLRQDPVIDALMPLYLSEELSPRFAKHKVSKTWEYRKAVEASLRNQIGEDRVREFEDGGRDEGLRDVMDSDEAGLEGVPLRPRTVKEVREAALAEHDEEVTEERMRVKEFLVRGWNWDRERNQWIRGGKALRTQRKKLKKVEKAKRLEVRMRDLQLKPGKNVVVPKGLGLEESRMVEAR